MVDARSASNYGVRSVQENDLMTQISASSVQPFKRGVVLQTICDPSNKDDLSNFRDENGKDSILNVSDYDKAPRNSIICRIISDDQGKDKNSSFVCFPFFSSHIMMPVKAGEQVWIFFEDPINQSGTPYWVSRISEPLHVEDANFTHGDRRTQGVIPRNDLPDKFKEDGSGNFEASRKLKFQNGQQTKSQSATIKGGQDAFVKIITESKEYNSVSFEPVPRITKRPGDLVLQGSNNASIRLGTAMGWNSLTRPMSGSNTSIASTATSGPGLGTIDIVTGRGRIYQAFDAEKKVDKKKGNSPEKSTRPFVEENVLGKFETDKNIATQQDEDVSKSKGNFKSNPYEGDPDYFLDDSRVLVSSNISVDSEFGTGAVGVASPFGDPIADMTGAAIVVKSDHIRIVARKSQLQSGAEPSDISNQNPATNGSIRIVKEGKNQEDRATIVIEPDGTIQISGTKIFLGRVSQDGGDGTGPGPKGEQPYVKYQQLEDLLKKTYENLESFAKDLKTNFAPSALGGLNATPGFGAPNPGLAKSVASCIKLISAMTKRKSEIQKLKSDRIFGE